jgi:hypothetical protein
MFVGDEGEIEKNVVAGEEFDKGVGGGEFGLFLLFK